MKKILTSIYFLLAVAQVWAVDVYDTKTNLLFIPIVHVGSPYWTIYTNVSVHVGSVLVVNGGSSILGWSQGGSLIDDFDPVTSQLTITSVMVNGVRYSNVIVKLADVVGVGNGTPCAAPLMQSSLPTQFSVCSSQQPYIAIASAYGCATPNVSSLLNDGADFVATVGDYTVTTNSWGRSNIPSFKSCVQIDPFKVGAENFGISANFSFDWPILWNGVNATKDFSEILWTPNGVKLTPIKIMDVANLTASYEIVTTTNGSYSASIQMMMSSSSSILDPTITYPIDFNIALNTTGPNGYTPQYSATLNGQLYEVFYFDKPAPDGTPHKSILFSLPPVPKIFVSADSLKTYTENLKSDLLLKPFIEFALAKGMLADNTYIHTLELGSEKYFGSGNFYIKSFVVKR